MKILVYGAGPLGSLFALRLYQAGHDVSILARGQRLAELREHGIVLEEAMTGQRTTGRIPIVEGLAPGDAYDLVLVIMRKNRALEVLPVLAANQHTPNVLFLMNNAAGPDELVRALGKERVLMGFPMSAGYREGHVIRYVGGSAEHKATIPIGEVDGRITERARRVAEALCSLPGYDVEIRTDMDAWLKTHVALLMPAIAPALYGAGVDRCRLAHTRDLLVLTVRAVREGFQVLETLGVPITPARYKQFKWIPEPFLVALLQHVLPREEMQVALAGHALAARDEIKHLADEFLVLIRRSGVPTPAIYRLYPYFDPEMPLMPQGSAIIRMDWRGVWLGLAALGSLLGGIALVWNRLRSRKE